MKVRYERTAFYYETDQMAIIHHANYIRWLEEARIFAMQQVGIDYAAMEKEGVQIPVLGVECTYRSMVRFGDTVNIDAWVEAFWRRPVGARFRSSAGCPLCTSAFSGSWNRNRAKVES